MTTYSKKQTFKENIWIKDQWHKTKSNKNPRRHMTKTKPVQKTNDKETKEN